MSALVTGMPQWIGWLYGAVAAVAAVTDYRTGKIYNVLTLPAIVFGIAAAAWLGKAPLVDSLAGFGLATLFFFPMFLGGILGGGDVKLLMGLGTVLGAQGTLQLTAACLLIAGAGAVVLLIKHRRAKIFVTQLWLFFRSLVVPGLEIQWPRLSREIKAPFGIAIFLGLVFVLLEGRV